MVKIKKKLPLTPSTAACVKIETLRKYDPTDMCELDKQVLDGIIQEYWNRPETMTFDTFFFSEYFLDDFTKKEIIYMDINGDIPFQLIYFPQDDKEFAAARNDIK